METDDDNNKQRSVPAYATPINQYGSSILILTNPDDVLYQKELMLKGLGVNDKGEVVKIGEPLLSLKGVNELISTAKSITSRNANMSNLSDIQEVDKLRNLFAENIIQTLMVSRVKYKIRDPEVTRSMIVSDLAVSAHISLKRAFLEGDKRFLGKTTQEVNQNIQAQQQKSKGLLGSILGW